MKPSWKLSRLKKISMGSLVKTGTLFLVVVITALYRFYQPLTHPDLLQFDIFDWMKRSQDILLFGKMTNPTTLWLFPLINAWVAKLLGGDLFSVYLYSGAILTTLNIILLIGSTKLLWPKRILPVVLIVLFYGLNVQLLARSINYLPETMTYTFGLAMVYCYLLLFLRRSWKIIPIILLLNYLFYHLHQSGLNFIVFSIFVLIAYIVWLVRLKRRWRFLLLIAGLVLASGLILLSDPLRQQFLFFLQTGKNTDTAFQGTAIPFEQIMSDYPLALLGFMAIGVFVIILSCFRKKTSGYRLSLLMLLGITGFYFSFLYVLPNAGLYSLIPWRFYTWFSLYGVFVATIGAVHFFDHFREQKNVAYIALVFIAITMFHSSVVPDNMFTADRNTLKSIQNAPIPKGSTIMTTNANQLQTRFALDGKDIIIREVGPALFRAADTASAVAYLLPRLDGRPTFILISKYQLRQRPVSIDYWRNSAIYDMKVENFNDQNFFENVFENRDIVIYQFRVDS